MKQKRFIESGAYRFKRFARKAYSAFNSLHRVVNIGVVVGCTLVAVPVVSASAQSSEKDFEPTLIEKELDEVMVTASRVEMPIGQTSKLVTIITKEQIGQAPVQSIQDLLVHIASIDVVQRGGHGVQADISIRGGSFDQNAVLLNGINLSSSHTGHYNFDIPINISDIERIEILHGPSALVYGANAFSGGINIITKKRVDEKGYISVEAGMHKLRTMEARGATELGATTNSLSVGYSSSDGYVANSDYDIYNVLWQTRLKMKGNSKLDFQLGYNDKQYGANTFYSAAHPEQYERTSTYMSTVKGEFGSKLKFIPIVYWSRHHDQFDLVKDTDFGRNYHRNDTYGANMILSYSSALGNTSLGSEIRREDIMSSNLGKPMAKKHGKYAMYDDRTNWSVGLEHTASIDKVVLSAGILMNYNTLEAGNYKFYPSVSASYNPSDEWKILTTWSKSSRMPTFTDLYSTTETHNGNDRLKAERSESLDLGVKYTTPIVSAYATGYMMWGRDIIDWVKADATVAKWSSWNHTQIDTKGIELGAKLHFGRLCPALGESSYLAVDYSQMVQNRDASDLISLYSLNYLKSKFTTQLNHKIYKGLTAGWYFRFQKRAGSYEEYIENKPAGRVNYPFFSTLDVKLNYKIDNLNIHLSMNNLYNRDYYDMGNIPQPGFWLMGGISYTFR